VEVDLARPGRSAGRHRPPGDPHKNQKPQEERREHEDDRAGDAAENRDPAEDRREPDDSDDEADEDGASVEPDPHAAWTAVEAFKAAARTPGFVRARARVTLKYGSRTEADRVDRATRVDHGGFLESKVTGAAIEAEAAADSPLALLHTLEDYLACVTVAEKVSRR